MRDKGDSTLQVFSVPVAVHSAIEDSGLETDNGLLESQIQLTNKVARMATPKETHTSGCNSLPLWKHLATHNEATRKTTLTWKKRGGGKAMYTTKQAPLSSEHQRNNETDATRTLWTANSVSSPDISVILQSFVVCLVVLNEGKHRPGDVLYFIRQLSAAAVNLSSKDILQGRIILSNDTDLNQERHFRVVLRAPCEPTEHCETLQTRMEEFVTSGSLNANQADSDFNGVTVRLQSLEYVNKELRLPLEGMAKQRLPAWQIALLSCVGVAVACVSAFVGIAIRTHARSAPDASLPSIEKYKTDSMKMRLSSVQLSAEPHDLSFTFIQGSRSDSELSPWMAPPGYSTFGSLPKAASAMSPASFASRHAALARA